LHFHAFHLDGGQPFDLFWYAHVFEAMKEKSFLALATFIGAALAWPQWSLGGDASFSPSREYGERRVGRSSAQAGSPSGPLLQRDSGPARSQIHDSAGRKNVRGPKVIVVDDREFSVTIEQTQQQTAPTQTKVGPKKKIYQPARWVATEHGVEVLEHGRWVEVGAEKEY